MARKPRTSRERRPRPSPEKVAKEALRRSEERFTRLAAYLPGMVYEYVVKPDGAGQFRFVGPRCREILELDVQAPLEDMGRFWGLVHPGDLERLRSEEARSNRQGRQFSAECRIITPSGKLKWISLTATSEPGKGSTFRVELPVVSDGA
jgi:PAS domain-containing protein